MVAIIRIPKLGLSDRAELVSWEVDVGDSIDEGDIVVVLESEKASAEVESPADGVLLATYVDEGEEVDVEIGRPLGAVGEEGETAPPLAEVESEPEPDADASEPTGAAESATKATDQTDTSDEDVTATPRAKRDAEQHAVDLSSIKGTGPQGAVTSDDVARHLEERGSDECDDESDDSSSTGIGATPGAKRAAREQEVDVDAIKGTGPKGAVTVGDVERYVTDDSDSMEDAESSGGTPAAERAGLTVVESTELRGTRRTIAERLQQSAREKPHVMGTREIPIDRLEAVRERLEEKANVDVSLNDLLLYFVGQVLEDLPEFNAHFEDDCHRMIEEVNVGYAVDGPRGLTVPVVDDVTERSVPEVAARRRELVDRVLNDEHSVEDLTGGTFTVTNVGVFGMDISYSIINPPEVAILAVGRKKYAPVERDEDGEIDFQRVATFSLTIDHRVLDGADSGAFLERLASYLAEPGSVLDGVSNA